MALLSILIATIASFAAGAVWYNRFGDPWMSAARIARNADGTPIQPPSPLIFVATFVLQLLVAGMMRHMLTSAGITSIFGSLISGIGVGLFLISPWIAINNLYCGRPIKLTLIDGGYATTACAIMGLVLGIF